MASCIARIRHFCRRREGQALAEFAIAFPLQLLITFGVMQMALLYISALVTEYASFRAARAAIVTPDETRAELEATEAALIVLAPLAHTGTAENSEGTIDVPGMGELEGSDLARDRVRVVLDYSGADSDGVEQDLTATVEWHQELVFPFVDRLCAMLLGSEDVSAFAQETESIDNFSALPEFQEIPANSVVRYNRRDGNYYYVLVRSCTLYMRQGTNPRLRIEGF